MKLDVHTQLILIQYDWICISYLFICQLENCLRRWYAYTVYTYLLFVYKTRKVLAVSLRFFYTFRLENNSMSMIWAKTTYANNTHTSFENWIGCLPKCIGFGLSPCPLIARHTFSWRKTGAKINIHFPKFQQAIQINELFTPRSTQIQRVCVCRIVHKKNIRKFCRYNMHSRARNLIHKWLNNETFDVCKILSIPKWERSQKASELNSI